MLELIDAAVESFLRAMVPLSAADVDVSFEAPDREWSAKLTRPTVNVFLWDVRRSSERSRGGVEELERDGRLVRRAALPIVELRFIVTAWTTDHGDERALLSGVLRAVLANGAIPAGYVPEPLQELPPIQVILARVADQGPPVGEVLDGQWRPSIALTLVTAVDTGVLTPAGPPVEVLELRSTPAGSERPSFAVRRVAGEIADPASIGATVTSPRGTALVDPAGRFVVRASPGDELVIDTDPPRTITVPLEGGVRLT